MHRYIYGDLNPVSNTDPSGQRSLTESMLIVVAAGYLASTAQVAAGNLVSTIAGYPGHFRLEGLMATVKLGNSMLRSRAPVAAGGGLFLARSAENPNAGFRKMSRRVAQSHRPDHATAGGGAIRSFRTNCPSRSVGHHSM